jgi:predicted ATPase/class 3 adenylate cyclase
LTVALERRLAAVMFTDMVGYTALVQADERAGIEQRDRYWEALERGHDAFDGTIVQRLGDGSMSMFPSALGAVQAAVAVQRELAPDVPVRIGIHVGDVIVEPDRLTGLAVNIAARIESFATPGGAMLSDSAYEQIRNQTDLDAVPLGRFKLKNVGRPFDLYAVAADGLAVPDAAELEGKGERFASLPSNLPETTDALVGRDVDLEALAQLLREHRVVSITGPGGVGKTRIVTELGRSLAPEFLDGVAFVGLADVTEPEAFLPAIAVALDVKEAEGRTLADGLLALIGDRRALLLLDNLEQVVSAAPEVARLVERCPELRVVATTRTPLRIAGEHEFPLAPLAESPAVELLVERARAAKPTFELTADNEQAVRTICSRLDGLPLALQLAAARLRLLSPEALLERLDHALQVLTSGPRDAPERQQTLRAAIDWSHSLLGESEQRLFRHMGVLAGGCTFEDLEAVSGEDALDDLESLVDKALVVADGDRFRMLQTIAEFAGEQLDAAGERHELALRHAHRYAEVVREIRDGVEGTTQLASIERGLAEDANVDAALDTLLAAGEIEQGLQICGDLMMYWHIRGRNITARERAAAFLARSDAETVGRANALLTAGLASWMLGEFERTNEEWSDAYRIATELGAVRESCMAGWSHGFGLLGFDDDRGLELAAESVQRSRDAGFTWCEGFGLSVEGIFRSVIGDLEGARARYEAALVIQQRIGDHEGAGLSLGGLAGLAAGGGDLAEALDLYNRALDEFEAIGDRAEQARILSELAWTHLRAGETATARERFFDTIQAYEDVASVRGVGLSLLGLAAKEAAEGRPLPAVQLAAAAEVYARAEGIVNAYSPETPAGEFLEPARAALSEDEFAAAAAAGERLTVGEALDLARSAT